MAVSTAKQVECRLYENIVDEEKGKLNDDGTLNLNPNSLTILKECYLEPALKTAKAFDSFHAGPGKCKALSGRTLGIICSKSIKGKLLHHQMTAEPVKLHSGSNSMAVPFFFFHPFSLGPSAVAVGNDSDMFGDSCHNNVCSFPGSFLYVNHRFMESIDREKEEYA